MDPIREPLLVKEGDSYEATPTVETQQSRPCPRRERFYRRTLPAVLLIISLWLVFRSFFVFNHHFCPHKMRPHIGFADHEQQTPSIDSKRVELEAHIMSKCPDAKYCLKNMVVPAMEKISDIVDFKLSYIGTVDPDSDEVSCKHGAGECLGNIIQLCAAKEYPDPKISLGFANCMTSQYEDIPKRELVEECAMEHGVDFSKLNNCISDEGEGIDLLRKSVERSRDAGVTKSCTVRLAGKVRCIRDGGEWYDCPGGSEASDLVADVKDLYKKKD